MTRATLGRDEVHVWRFSLSLSSDRQAHLERTLSPDELRRAARFHAERDARRFVAARGCLRILLGRYARREPHALAFRYGRAGKPELSAPATGGRLRFNLAHTGPVGLLAVTWERRVGIDVEAVRRVPELDGIVGRYFSSRERRELLELPPDRRREAFFRGWTRKEAIAKAVGDGLQRAFDRIEVPLVPLRRPTLLALPGDDAASAFVVEQVHAGSGLEAAVAVEAGRRPPMRTTFHHSDALAVGEATMGKSPSVAFGPDGQRTKTGRATDVSHPGPLHGRR